MGIAWIRVAVVFSLVSLLVFEVLLSPQQVAAQRCAVPGRCYGVNIWGGSVPGLSTEVLIREIQTNQPGSRISNQAWLVDYDNCAQRCWVEAGIFSIDGGPRSFFSENKTNAFPYRLDAIAPVTSSDIGGYLLVQVVQGINIKQQYNVCLISPTLSTCYGYGDNYWFPNEIHIGEEMANIPASFSPQTLWRNNAYISEYAPGQYGLYYQFRQGDIVIIDNPPYAGWAVGNAPNQSSTGGLWVANCC